MIDSHQHFWSLANGYTTWPTPDLAPIHRDFGPGDLAPLLEQNRVSGTVLVQAAPSFEETKDFLAIAEATDFVKGVVGWVDFEAAEARDRIEEIAPHPLLKGLRPMIQSEERPGWILQAAFEPVLAAMIERGLTFDALVLHHQLGDIVELAKRHPGLRIVLDHAGKPPIASGDTGQWQADIAALAECENAWCKVSGLWTEAEDRSDTAIAPYVSAIRDAFGCERLIWGSDWPVLGLAGSYGNWLAQAQRFFADETDEVRAAVFGGNAAAFYGLRDA